MSPGLGHRGPTQRPVSVGLTGSLASGKSTSLEVFSKLGWRVCSADELVAEIYQEKGIRKEDLKSRFKASKEGLKVLQQWQKKIHPLVRAKILKWMKKSRKPAVVEVPLLFEAGFDRYFDWNVFIFAPKDKRRKRAQKRGMPKSLFEFLDRQQWAPSQKARAADFVLHNHHKPELRKQVRALSKFLLSLEER